LREEVPGAIAECHKAGIDVKMVTGDNQETAIAIGRNAGLLDVHADRFIDFGPRF